MSTPVGPGAATDFLDIAAEFPFRAGAFGELQRYIRGVAQFSDHASAQTALRLAAQLQHEFDPVRQAELEYEIEVVNHDAEKTIPRVVWGSVLVAIYATYESSVSTAFTFWQKHVPGVPRFNPKTEREFLKSAESYAKTVVQVQLFQSPSTREAVFELKALRNAFSHNAGRMPAQKTELQSALEAARKRSLEITVTEEFWIATPRVAAYYVLATERAYREFANEVLHRYVSHVQSRFP